MNKIFRHFASFSAAALLAGIVTVNTGCELDTRKVEAPPVQLVPAQPAPAQAASASATQTPSLDALRTDLIRSKGQIQGALDSLSQLTDPKTPAADLNKLFVVYSDQLAQINDNSERLNREADAMRASREAYFAKWEDKMSEIDNPSIRASAEERKARLRAGYDRITAAAISAKEAYQPFMRDLQDVRKYLAADLTPTSAAMLGDVSKRSNADGAVVQSRISAVIAELDAVSGDVR